MLLSLRENFILAGRGGLFEKGSVSQRETEVSLKKNKQDIKDIFSTMELQGPGTTLLRIEMCACS